MKNFLLQLDFNTRTIFNIEKGIIKKQFPFSQVKGCEDTERRRFSIVFHGRQDYELEAVSLDDKRKVSLWKAPDIAVNPSWWGGGTQQVPGIAGLCAGREGGMSVFRGCSGTEQRECELRKKFGLRILAQFIGLGV